MNSNPLYYLTKVEGFVSFWSYVSLCSDKKSNENSGEKSIVQKLKSNRYKKCVKKIDSYLRHTRAVVCVCLVL